MRVLRKGLISEYSKYWRTEWLMILEPKSLEEQKDGGWRNILTLEFYRNTGLR